MKIKDELVEFSAHQIFQTHLSTNYEAILTSFLNNDERRVSKKKSLEGKSESERIEDLAKDLKYIGYDFIRVDGDYSFEGESSGNSVEEVSFFIKSPRGESSAKPLIKDMVNLARKYEQEYFIVWLREEHLALLFGTTDFEHYEFWDVMGTPSTETPTEIWERYHRRWFSLPEDSREANRSSDAMKAVKLVQAEESGYPPDFRIYKFSRFRKELFGEWY